MIFEMLQQVSVEIKFAERPSLRIHQEQADLFLKKTNNIYNALQQVFGHKPNQISREVIARELTLQLTNRYPELITSLKEAFQEET